MIEIANHGEEWMCLECWKKEETVIFSEYFSRAKSNHPEIYNSYSFEHWLQYLAGRELVSQNGSRLTNTEEGREFLKYIINQRYTLIRPY